MPTTKPSHPIRPRQHQKSQPGSQRRMFPVPRGNAADYRASERLMGKTALITGADSGIGRAVAVAFAKEGADIAIVYLDEHEDAHETKRLVEEAGRRCILLSGDIGREPFCRSAVSRTVAALGRLDVLVNNAAEHHPEKDPSALTAAQIERVFRTNVFSAFHFIRHALPHLRKGSAIINTVSVVAYRGSPELIDYSATKGALLAMTRSLSLSLGKKGIRVNAVAPGPIWTPLIASSFSAKEVAEFGSNSPMGRAGEPDEVAPAFVYLACTDSSYVSGQCLHVNGGEVVNG